MPTRDEQGRELSAELRSHDDPESAEAAFCVTRDGSLRISSVEFSNFCIDGFGSPLG